MELILEKSIKPIVPYGDALKLSSAMQKVAICN